jgi:hypothetical protein
VRVIVAQKKVSTHGLFAHRHIALTSEISLKVLLCVEQRYLCCVCGQLQQSARQPLAAMSQSSDMQRTRNTNSVRASTHCASA